MDTKLRKAILAIAAATTSLLVALVIPAGAAPPRTGGGSGCAQFYTVRAGDNLYRIARRFGTTTRALSDLNGISDPNRILAGNTLCVKAQPPDPSGFWYTVKLGDTLYAIARRYGVTAAALASANHLSDPNRIVVGQKLLIPTSPKAIQVYFAHTSLSEGDQCVKPVSRSIAATSAVGQAAIKQLLLGPTASEKTSGYWTAIPDGTRLKSLRITGGVAYADFSSEIESFGGGSARVLCLRQEITRTLTQFSTVREVVISAEGRTEDVLQP